MAVAGMAAADNHPICSLLEGPQDKQRIDTAGAGNPDNLYLRRIRQTAGSSQICTGIAAPVAAESNNQRSKFCYLPVYRLMFYLHIASTSAINCLLEKPFKSIAPDGQATVHAPHPWHNAPLTTATRFTSRIPWSATCLSS